MPDPITAAKDAQEADDAMPKGDALALAEEELASVSPDTGAHPHFALEGDAERSIDEPMHDFIGRSDGP